MFRYFMLQFNIILNLYPNQSFPIYTKMLDIKLWLLAKLYFYFSLIPFKVIQYHQSSFDFKNYYIN